MGTPRRVGRSTRQVTGVTCLRNGRRGYLVGVDDGLREARLNKERSQMYRGTGTGLIGLGIVLVVIGAILKFAVTVTTSGLNINVIGVILLSVGIACCVIGAMVFGAGSFRPTHAPRERSYVHDGGQERVLQQARKLLTCSLRNSLDRQGRWLSRGHRPWRVRET